MTLPACVTSGSAPPARSLPAFPSYAKPIQVEPQDGEDSLSYATRERVGRVQANKIILNIEHWYAKVRQSYGVPQ